mmetsp:Transcript_14442/g.27514  ORF Transcript_14442/g.27514 Transcript_14442/m.27514 type:complete len:260 (-) Transcript_14442:889-1668(-)
MSALRIPHLRTSLSKTDANVELGTPALESLPAASPPLPENPRDTPITILIRKIRPVARTILLPIRQLFIDLGEQPLTSLPITSALAAPANISERSASRICDRLCSNISISSSRFTATAAMGNPAISVCTNEVSEELPPDIAETERRAVLEKESSLPWLVTAWARGLSSLLSPECWLLGPIFAVPKGVPEFATAASWNSEFLANAALPNLVADGALAISTRAGVLRDTSGIDLFFSRKRHFLNLSRSRGKVVSLPPVRGS